MNAFTLLLFAKSNGLTEEWSLNTP